MSITPLCNLPWFASYFSLQLLTFKKRIYTFSLILSYSTPKKPGFRCELYSLIHTEVNTIKIKRICPRAT